MMSGFEGRSYNWLRVLGLVVGLGLTGGVASARPGGGSARARPRPVRVVTVRQVIVRREPVVIHAVTLARLRGELRRARLAQAGYEQRIAQQYQTIRQLQAQTDTRVRELREANARRADQLDAQFEIILQAFGLVVFAIIGALLVALSRSHSREVGSTGARPAADPAAIPAWDPLQQQLGEAKSALATVEARLRRLELSISQERGG